jgi:head-tail adaptor
MTIERTVRFQLDIEADTRLDALRMVNTKALMYDDRDLKETRVIAIKELEEVAILHPLD